MKKAIVSVINDLTTDQRVHRHCLCLGDHNYQVQLVGRRLSSSSKLDERQYSTFRFKLPFDTGPLFYATYNIRLFFHLLFNRADLLFSNDLDTLLPNYLVSRLRRVELIYDSHELFTEVPELNGRNFVKSVWSRLERFLLRRLSNQITVSNCVAKEYKKRYDVEMAVLRNLPRISQTDITVSRKELGISENAKVIVFQGAINKDRGTEEAILAMKKLVGYHLFVIGDGDEMVNVIRLVEKTELRDRVSIMGRLEYSKMMAITKLADVGLCLPKPTCRSYECALPNKLFEYLHAGVPVVASDLEEVREIMGSHEIGIVIEEVSPQEIERAVKHIVEGSDCQMIVKNVRRTANSFTWEEERKVLDDILDRING